MLENGRNINTIRKSWEIFKMLYTYNLKALGVLVQNIK